MLQRIRIQNPTDFHSPQCSADSVSRLLHLLRRFRLFLLMPLIFGISLVEGGRKMRSLALQVTTRSTVQLPIVRPSPGLEDALAGRRSLREFSSRKLNDSQIARLLWAAQGITNREGLRTAPSAGALYPLVVYISSAEGTFRYDPQHSVLKRTTSTDLRQMLSTAALSQESVKDAPAVFVYTAVVQRTARKYGDRGRRYIYLEAGHSAQNLLLEATVLGLGGVPVGAFDDAKVAATLGLPSGEEPIYLVPVGYAR